MAEKRNMSTNKVTIFYLNNCPYCHSAKKAVEELKSNDAAYQAVDIEWIEESRNPEIADRFDYYYVPSVFNGEEKLYECSPADVYSTIRNNIKKALDSVIKLAEG